ncbi:MAG: hypothetical protein WCQ50_07745 [Spirochaetota bacterium]
MGSRDLSALSETDQQALIESGIALLKKEFGENWKKYALVRRSVVDFNVETGVSTTVLESTWVAPETAMSIFSGPATRALYSDSPVYNGYWTRQKAEQWWFVWGTYNDLYSTFFRYTSAFPADSISSQVIDARGTGQIQRTAFSSESGKAQGIPGGWFSWNIPYTGITVVQFPGLPNGELTLTHSWY